MDATEPVTLVSISAAALIIQITIVAIVFAGLITSESPPFAVAARRGIDAPTVSAIYPWAIFVFLITAVPICLSSDFFSIWRPLVRDNGFQGFSTESVLFFVLIVDILFVWVLLWNTGGSRDSVFSPFCFLLPSLALFLREPPLHVVIYLVLLGVVFTLTLYSRSGSAIVTRSNLAYWVVSLSSVALTTLIAIIARPA